MEKKIVGIIGGMGPLATADLFEKIICCTRASRDQDHLRVLIDSNTNIPDRTAALLHGGQDPTPHLVESARLLERPAPRYWSCPVTPLTTSTTAWRRRYRFRCCI